MDEKRKGILIAIFTGWLGGYRFYKKQYILGVVYLLSGGLFSIGWIIDIIIACRGGEKINNSSNDVHINRDDILTEFYTKVVGVTYPCVQGCYDTRQEALEDVRPLRDKLYLEYFTYEGEPAYRVCIKRNYSDVGDLKATLSKELYTKYNGCDVQIMDFDVTGGDGSNYGCNLKIRVTRNN